MITNNEPRWIMPFPTCPKCGNMITIDRNTYPDGEHVTACYFCKTQYRMKLATPIGVFAQANLQKVVWLKPLVDTDLLEGLMKPTVPKEIYNDFESTLYCFGAGVPPRAVAVMCRYTIQHALILKGIPENRDMKEMIDIAGSKNILSEIAVKQSQAIRFIGGKGAHPQEHWTLEIMPEDAKQAVLFAKRVLIELWPQSIPPTA